MISWTSPLVYDVRESQEPGADLEVALENGAQVDAKTRGRFDGAFSRTGAAMGPLGKKLHHAPKVCKTGNGAHGQAGRVLRPGNEVLNLACGGLPDEERLALAIELLYPANAFDHQRPSSNLFPGDSPQKSFLSLFPGQKADLKGVRGSKAALRPVHEKEEIEKIQAEELFLRGRLGSRASFSGAEEDERRKDRAEQEAMQKRAETCAHPAYAHEFE